MLVLYAVSLILQLIRLFIFKRSCKVTKVNGTSILSEISVDNASDILYLSNIQAIIESEQLDNKRGKCHFKGWAQSTFLTHQIPISEADPDISIRGGPLFFLFLFLGK